jgi:hypothetical protein
MTKTQRLEFMRAKFKQKVPIQPLRLRQTATVCIGQNYFNGTLSILVDQHTKEMPCQWVRMPVKLPAPCLALKRTTRILPLTKIAHKWGTPEWFQKRPNRPLINKP